MERETLYTLHTIAIVIVTLFLFKMDKTFSNQVLTVRKRCSFLTLKRFCFSIFTYLSSQIVHLKTTNISVVVALKALQFP